LASKIQLQWLCIYNYMGIFSFFQRKPKPSRSSAAEWKLRWSAKPDWELQNAVRNPGEFVAEARQAARDLLAERGVPPQK
jgi:hypothetical protein